MKHSKPDYQRIAELEYELDITDVPPPYAGRPGEIIRVSQSLANAHVVLKELYADELDRQILEEPAKSGHKDLGRDSGRELL